MLPTAAHIEEIARLLDLDVSTVRTVAKPILLAMEVAGEALLCECGSAKFHPGWCAWRRAKPSGPRKDVAVELIKQGLTYDQIEQQLGLKKGGAKWYRRYLTPAEELQRRRAEAEARILAERAGPFKDAAVKLIKQGLTYGQIEQRLGLKRGSARWYRRYLTPAEERQRRLAETENRRRAAACLRTPHVVRDPLYAAIDQAVSRSIDPSLRDDIISDAYVAVLDGKISAADIAANMSKFVGAAFNAWSPKFGHLSLDTKPFGDSERTFVETIEDPSALEAFERLDNIELGSWA